MFRRCAAKEHTSPSLVVTPSSLEHSAGVLALEFLASRKKKFIWDELAHIPQLKLLVVASRRHRCLGGGSYGAGIALFICQ
jgi:hypothetical protein